jgi:acylphosphatase
MIEAYRIIVCGEVQKTGFRRFVWRNAMKLGIKGYVKNLPNGCVEVLAVNNSGSIEILCKKIKEAIVFNISKIDINSIKLDKEPKEFTII